MPQFCSMYKMFASEDQCSLYRMFASKNKRRDIVKNDRNVRARVYADRLTNAIDAFQREDGLVLHLLSYFQLSEVMKSKRVNQRWKALCVSTIDENFQPKKEFEDGDELTETVRWYCTYTPWSMNKIARTYGFPIGRWKVQKVEIFDYVFFCRDNFNEDISKWDMSSAKSMISMFEDASSFNKPLDCWDTSSVANMDNVFAGAEAFNQPLNSWRTRRVRTMSSMFDGAMSFNQPLDNWDTSQVKFMCSMFKGAKAFNQSLALWDLSSSPTYQGILIGADAYECELPPQWNRWRSYGNW